MRIVLVDDHHEVLTSLAEFMRGLGHVIETVNDGATALKCIRQRRPDFVLTDVRMPGMDGLALLSALEDTEPPIAVALMTAHSDTAIAVEALRHGAVDYLRKPIDVSELHALLERLAQTIAPFSEPFTSEPQADGLVIGGTALASVVALSDRLHAVSTLPCVIEAETGCGKELIARRIHHGGRIEDRRPWVPINCAAISPGLFEAELFGYAPGAFTGALAAGAAGKLALSGDGTLFLDEVAELTLEQQAKLLRVLEDRSWFPVGSNRVQRLNSRVVCASNRPLADLVAAGRFREDLLYRLKVGFVRIPPLRERREEIPVLARSLLKGIRRRLGRGFSGISAGAGQLLAQQSWPGNVRQLAHLLEIAAVTLDGEMLTEAQAQSLLGIRPQDERKPPAQAVALPTDPPAGLALADGHFDLDGWQRAIIATALAKHGGSPVSTASFLGITRKVLYTLRKRYGLIAAEQSDDA